MPYKTGSWGEQAKARSKERIEYFRKLNKTRHEQQYKKRFRSFGSLGELIALKFLNNSILVRKQGFDITWKNQKIEVKISAYKEKYKYWLFHTGRQKNKTNYFFLILTEKDKKTIYKIYMVPNENIPNVQTLTINRHESKFNKFLVEREVING